MGAHINRTINSRGGPYVFSINGQLHHRIGSLVPCDQTPPRFIQLYIYDIDNEVDNRIRALDIYENTDGQLDPVIVSSLIDMFNEHNPLVQQFRHARDSLRLSGDDSIGIRIVGARPGDPVQYNLPTCDELALLVVGDFSLDTYKRDIIVHNKSDDLRRISPLHPAFMALQYPLLFPYGERGFQVDVPYTVVDPNDSRTRSKITMQDYFRYYFHYRKHQPNPYLKCGRLSSQIKVDARACIDECRIQYILDHQADLRIDTLQGVADAVASGSIDANDIGKRIILPASYTGGRRYMIQNYHDAIAICRVHGPPDLFVTFTCNPKWPKIYDALHFEPGQRSIDRADIIDRVYNTKLEELLEDIKDGSDFGPVDACMFLSNSFVSPSAILLIPSLRTFCLSIFLLIYIFRSFP